MPATLYPDKGYFPWTQCLQFFTLANWYQPIFGAMNNVRMAVYLG